MSRWIRPRQLVELGITIQEQIDWASIGLNVYDNNGRKVVEYKSTKILEDGCIYLTNEDFLFCGDTSKYCSWNKSHSFFEKFMFNSDELIHFITTTKIQFQKILYSTISKINKFDGEEQLKQYLELEGKKSPTILDKIFSIELANLLDLPKSMYPLKNKHSIHTETHEKHLSSDIYTENNNIHSSGRRQIKTAKAWADDLEIAVALAAECAASNKPRSTEQHRRMWERKCSENGILSPRKEAFAAFRRGLPAYLKMEKC